MPLIKPKSVPQKNNNIKIIVGLVIVIALVVFGYFLIPLLTKPKEKLEKSIAVLPFENMSNDPEQDYFSDGMMQETLNQLFKIGGLIIPSGTSSMRFKGSKLSVREIAQKLNVSYVLEGNVSKSGDNVRIIVRLINGGNEHLIWTEDYKKTITAINLLEIQSDVAQQVAEKMFCVYYNLQSIIFVNIHNTYHAYSVRSAPVSKSKQF